ncbi:MAG: phosphonate ABC transporter, permease protein PhnE [Armatimonadota bacterium]|nr:phosphonate ABC transporter, permease protein PhnE [Armatimonadota bacterium]
MRTSPVKPEPARSPVAATLLSIAPGLGQIYCGQYKRGLAILAVLLAQIGVAVMAGMPAASLWLILIWLWNIADAWGLATGRRGSPAIPIVVLTLLNLALCWRLSEIGTQIRQVDLPSGLANARNLVSALAQPDVLRTSDLQTADANLIVTKSEVSGRPETFEKRRPRLNLIPTDKGRITAAGRGFAPGAQGAVYLRAGGDKKLADVATDRSGAFRVTFANPIRLPGSYWVQAEVKKPLPLLQWRMSDTLDQSLKLMRETVFLAFIGTAVALIISFPLSFLAARNLAAQIPAGWLLYSVTRSAFNILRSIEALIIAVVMAIIVGIGPLAGALALSIHGIGALGKLYSEAIESVEHGPIEAVMSTGANWLQVVRFGAVPQVVPQFIAFTMYRWDINVRMATVIGLVGGGGIGNLLYSYINGLQWEKAATAIWLIAIVVMLMDYASAVIRERVV